MLSQRGLLPTFAHAGALAATYQNRPGFKYPVTYSAGVAWRWKALDGQKPKYVWLGGKPDACRYYTPFGLAHLRAAVAANEGALYIANGEPAVIAYHAAGVPNVLSWFGEANVPADLPAFLTDLGVRRLYYPADKDAAGVKSARKVRAALTHSALDFHPLRWGDSLPDHADANDLWMQVNFDPAAFRSALANLDALILPAEVELPKAPRPIFDPVSAARDRQDAIDQILRLLDMKGSRKPNAKGWITSLHCPFHDDHNPSASFNVESGTLTCHGSCGHNYTLAEVCARFGIAWERERPPERRAVEHPTAAPIEQPMPTGAPSWFGGHLPNTWRTALLVLSDPTAAVVELIERAAAAGDISLSAFTLSDLLACQSKHGFDLSKTTLFAALLSVRSIFNTKEKPDIDSNAKNGTRGVYYVPQDAETALSSLLDALEAHYLLHPFTPEHFLGFDDLVHDRAGMSQRLNDSLEKERSLSANEAADRRAWWTKRLTWHNSTPLPAGWTIDGTTSYRAAYLRGMIVEQPDRQRSYKQIAALLGCGVGSVKKYIMLAGAKNEVQIKVVAVASAAEVRAAQYQHKARVCYYEAVYPDSSVVRSYFADDTEFVEAHVRQGAVVQVELQGASKQRVIKDTPPEKPARPPHQRAQSEESAPRITAPSGELSEIEPERERYLRQQFSLALRLCETPTRGSNWILPTGELVAKRAGSKTLLRALLAVLDERDERKHPKASDLVF